MAPSEPTLVALEVGAAPPDLNSPCKCNLRRTHAVTFPWSVSALLGNENFFWYLLRQDDQQLPELFLTVGRSKKARSNSGIFILVFDRTQHCSYSFPCFKGRIRVGTRSISTIIPFQIYAAFLHCWIGVMQWTRWDDANSKRCRCALHSFVPIGYHPIYLVSVS
ncbi:hypothetical protein GYMLUDRAFT_620906 [Collybiopsis luxurians FD-317 M1]|nr:hypothetical protein GYMLUDRAFT_620906 [Collybiopsis luxurians FD-317 M1]